MPLKRLAWSGSAQDDLRAFPDEARQRAGFELYRLQQGLEPTDWKPMTSVGSGVREIRIEVGRTFRVLYVAKFAEAIYVLHAFEKKTQRTAQRDLDLTQQRLAEALRQRRSQRRSAMPTTRRPQTAFEALGYAPEEAEYLRIRADLMLALGTVIAERGWTQSEAAQALGVTQPRISDLLRGKIDRFSIDTLVQLLAQTGAAVTVKVRHRRSAA